MPIVKPRSMPGALELLPPEQIELERMMGVIRTEFERFGFLPISTPALELTEVLLNKTGGETERQVYLTQSTGSRSLGHEPDLALRFDLTVPLARYVAEHEGQLSFPFRRYQIQPVWRGETPQRGRFREFIQCDVDVVARDDLSLRYDAEMATVIASVFTKLAFGPFTIRLNNRRLLRGLLTSLGVGEGQQVAVLRALDKLERSGAEQVVNALSGEGLGDPAVTRLLEMAGGGPRKGEAARDAIRSLPGDNELLRQGKEELLEVLSLIEMTGVADAVAVDLSIARGLDYYTGTVYETSLDAHPELGSICSGGRYDDLASLYTSSRLPGVGISIGLTRLFWQLRELGLVGKGGLLQALVTLIDDPGLETALAIGATLRNAGINTEVSLQPAKLSRQLRYADRSGIPVVIIAGEEERSRGTIQVRNLATTEQTEVELADLVATVRRQL